MSSTFTFRSSASHKYKVMSCKSWNLWAWLSLCTIVFTLLYVLYFLSYFLHKAYKQKLSTKFQSPRLLIYDKTIPLWILYFIEKGRCWCRHPLLTEPYSEVLRHFIIKYQPPKVYQNCQEEIVKISLDSDTWNQWVSGQRLRFDQTDILSQPIFLPIPIQIYLYQYIGHRYRYFHFCRYFADNCYLGRYMPIFWPISM